MEKEYKEIDLQELLYVLRKKILVIILVAVLGAGCAFAYSQFAATPMYKATSKLYIMMKDNEKLGITGLQGLEMSMDLTRDYAELIKSRPVVEKVNSNLDLGMSYEKLVKQVSVNNPDDTRIMEIGISNSNSKTARNIANEFAEVAKKQISEIMKTDEPTVVEYAVIPKAPYSPDKTRNTLLGFLIGLLLSSIIILVLHFMNDNIVNQEDIEKNLGLPVLATIPIDRKAMRKTKKDSKRKRKGSDDKRGGV